RFFGEANWDWSGLSYSDDDSDYYGYEDVDDDESFEEWSKYAVNMDNLLIHIPFRQGWWDEVSNLNLDEAKLFIFAGCRGHGKLFNKLWPTACEKLAFSFESTLYHIVGMVSGWGYCDFVKKVLKEGYDGLDNVEQALDLAAGGGHLEVVKELLTLSEHSVDSAFVEASKMGHLQVVRFLFDNYSVDPGCFDNSATIYACGNGKLDVVKLHWSKEE
ncbi:hypothetical protein HDU76_002399, partial [Blyttiomyces sp. JEL0837]